MSEYAIGIEELTPSYHGEKCRYNRNHPEYEIACDECDYALTCMPDNRYFERFPDDRALESIKTAPDEALEAFLTANREKPCICDIDMEIDREITEELSRRHKSNEKRSRNRTV